MVAFLDESVLSFRNPVFANWPRLPLQAELFGHQLAGEIFFQELQKTLNRSDSQETADLLEVYYLCLLLGFKGRYAAGGDLRSIMAAIQEKIRRVRGPSAGIVAARSNSGGRGSPGPVGSLGAQAGHRGRGHFPLALAVFLVFKFLLMSGASELSASAMQFVK